MIGSPPAIENNVASYSQDNGLKRKSECVIFFVCVTDGKMSDVCLRVLLREKEREKHVSYILALLCEYKMLPLC